MSDSDNAVRRGHYARKQLFSKSRAVSWVHGSRYGLGQELFRRFGSGRLLDYGCGDGTMLAMLTSMDSSPTEAVGLELAESSVDECRVRFASQVRLSFEAIDGYFVESNQVSFDTVMCTEVLEHVVHVDAVIDDLAFVLKPDGRLIVSVPVETGLPLVAKQIARRVLGWRGIGDYPGNTPYSITELLKSIVAGKDQHIVRPIHEYCGVGSHDHKGFNWRHLEKRLERRFVIEHRFGSPIAWLTPGMNSQVWFVCKRRDVS